MAAPDDDTGTAGVETPAAVFPFALKGLRKRSEFLAAARARWTHRPGLTLQVRDRGDGDDTVRVGFTCSKKVGNAVARNRAKRRLREVARIILPSHGHPGHDYVLIGRKDATAERDFAALQDDLRAALAKLHP